MDKPNKLISAVPGGPIIIKNPGPARRIGLSRRSKPKKSIDSLNPRPSPSQNEGKEKSNLNEINSVSPAKPIKEATTTMTRPKVLPMSSKTTKKQDKSIEDTETSSMINVPADFNPADHISMNNPNKLISAVKDGPIKQSFLTPLRRMGLSRSRVLKTPKSIDKLMSSPLISPKDGINPTLQPSATVSEPMGAKPKEERSVKIKKLDFKSMNSAKIISKKDKPKADEVAQNLAEICVPKKEEDNETVFENQENIVKVENNKKGKQLKRKRDNNPQSNLEVEYEKEGFSKQETMKVKNKRIKRQINKKEIIEEGKEEENVSLKYQKNNDSSSDEDISLADLKSQPPKSVKHEKLFEEISELKSIDNTFQKEEENKEKVHIEENDKCDIENVEHEPEHDVAKKIPKNKHTRKVTKSKSKNSKKRRVISDSSSDDDICLAALSSNRVNKKPNEEHQNKTNSSEIKNSIEAKKGSTSKTSIKSSQNLSAKPSKILSTISKSGSEDDFEHFAPSEKSYNYSNSSLKRVPSGLEAIEKLNINSTQDKKNKRKIKKLAIPKSSSLFLSDSEDDFVQTPKRSNTSIKSHISETLGGLNIESSECEIIDVELLRNEVYELDKCVLEKKRKLEDLKQAVLYRKKHDVGELEKLTKVWKDGSKNALIELHKRLNENMPITLDKLMTNLNVPRDWFNFDLENDCFVE